MDSLRSVSTPSVSVEVNRTNTNLEAWFDYCTGWMATGTEMVSNALSSQPIASKVAHTLDQVVWASPLLTAQVAPKTFITALAFGGVTGLFSFNTMGKVFTHVDDILSGGKDNKNTNFKVSLIFAVVIASKLLPIIPSLPKFYAAAGGILLGIKLSQWISEKYAIAAAQCIDKYIQLPRCPGFNKA